MKVKTTMASVLVGLVGVVAMLLVPAASADAAVGYCLNTNSFNSGNGGYIFPAGIGSTAGVKCILTSGQNDNGGSYVGPSIHELQRALNKCYSAGLAVDGIYGSNTAAAVKAVQKKYNLSQDGSYGPNTGKAMYWPFYVTGAATTCKAADSYWS